MNRLRECGSSHTHEGVEVVCGREAGHPPGNHYTSAHGGVSWPTEIGVTGRELVWEEEVTFYPDGSAVVSLATADGRPTELNLTAARREALIGALLLPGETAWADDDPELAPAPRRRGAHRRQKEASRG
ncbi:hypothetical protein [Nocardiopsis sp. YSL2]|uniref:hypothetical protein n=1 Tax=Nocardiopsis sp. YSL2 TaxID=2939492 RepID=UPI0026F471D9|nr:hypothetical protein [Nocardiopsis sp. YSL2]